MNQSIFGSLAPKFVYNHGTASVNFTVDTYLDYCTSASAHNFTNKQKIQLLTTNILPSPLTVLTDYYVRVTGANTFQIMSTSYDSVPIDITDAGTGTHSFLKETGTTVLFNHWITSKDTTEDSRAIVNSSELSDDRQIFDLGGDFWEFFGKELIFKYADLSTQKAKFLEIYSHNHQLVILYKHQDGNYYEDSNGDPILFYVDCIPSTFDESDLDDYRDVLKVSFKSLKSIVSR